MIGQGLCRRAELRRGVGRLMALAMVVCTAWATLGADLPAPATRPPIVVGQTEGTLFAEDFQDGNADDWSLGAGWEVQREGDNYLLKGSRVPTNAFPLVSGWSDYTIRFRFKLNQDGFHANLRSDEGTRYLLALHSDQCTLHKQLGTDYFQLVRGSVCPTLRVWHDFEARLAGNRIKIYLDGRLSIDYTDREIPILTGTFNLEISENTTLYVDDFLVTGTKLVQTRKWVRTGGPLGGIGYDIRIDPRSPEVMFVTDNPSGVNKSYDGGKNWVQRNGGITSRGGSSGDAIPIFCLTIDPNDPDIVWAGTQSMCGIFRSTDNGETWTKKDNGIVEWNEITFRGFGVRPGNSNVVIAAAEITTGILGSEFDRAKGKIYKTVDGGENWHCVWQGDSLARVVLFDPSNPDIVYVSTGIFDREAYNTTGVGVLKSADGGETWKQVNNGLQDLFVGFLVMHPRDPKTLYAAAGRIGFPEHPDPGVFMTTDGGESWAKVFDSRTATTVVAISPSNPKVMYAGGELAFYRSDNAGRTWREFTKEGENCYGPPGIRAGFPISAVVDPNDPMTIYVNNYGGGAFRSTDGATTWVDWSRGYTGALVRGLAQDPSNPDCVYAITPTGPFQSLDGGRTWKGRGSSPADSGTWNTIAVNPRNPQEVLVGGEIEGDLLRSSNGGRTWTVVFDHPQANGYPTMRHGFKAIAYAPSDPKVIYAGMRRDRRTVNGDFPFTPSFGMFKSTDGGRTWKAANGGLEKTGKNINAIAVCPANPNTAYAATWGDGIFKTIDGGQTWVAVNDGLFSLDVRSLALDPSNPEVVYAGLAEGVGIFRTTNGGRLWEPINVGIRAECPSFLQRVGQAQVGVSLEKPKRTSISDYYSIPWTDIEAIVVDPLETQRLYAADVSRGVNMSTDGGESWVLINEGLRTRAVSALSLSFDGRVLYAGTEGGGVFRLDLWGGEPPAGFDGADDHTRIRLAPLSPATSTHVP